jgi:mono/diheme cytochrome c family protein
MHALPIGNRTSDHPGGASTYSTLLVVSLLALGSAGSFRVSADSARPASGMAAAQDTSRSVVEGVYTEVQAKRGRDAYLGECSRCHSETLQGGENETPALVGEQYEGLTLGDLFERIRVSMPQDSPGRLTRQQYSDITAYILRENGYPAGQTELETQASALKTIKFEKPRAQK